MAFSHGDTAFDFDAVLIVNDAVQDAFGDGTAFVFGPVTVNTVIPVYFSEDDTLLCSLDRVFDDATVFMIKGDSYRGRKLETLGLEAGIAKHTEYKNA